MTVMMAETSFKSERARYQLSCSLRLQGGLLQPGRHAHLPCLLLVRCQRTTSTRTFWPAEACTHAQALQLHLPALPSRSPSRCGVTAQPVTLQPQNDSDNDAQPPFTASQCRASKAQTAVQSGRGKQQSMAGKQLASHTDPTRRQEVISHEADGNAAALRSRPVSHTSVTPATAAAPAARPSQAARLSGQSGMGRKQESFPGSEQPGVGQPDMQQLAALCTVHWQHLK